MASLKEPQRMTDDLRTRAEDLHNQVVDGEVDLSTIVRLADELGGAADRVAATFDKVNDALEQQEDEGEARPRGELTEALAPGGREEEGSAAEAPKSREELYERAREADIEIPGEPDVPSEESA